MKGRPLKPENDRTFWSYLGPGLLFAGAAIGTSHLVQSTRAGASFGFGLLLVILAINALKYPAFRFGPDYVAATGRSLVSGYRSLGRWALLLLVISFLVVNMIVIAASALVTAGIAGAVLPITLSSSTLATLFIMTCLLYTSPSPRDA